MLKYTHVTTTSVLLLLLTSATFAVQVFEDCDCGFLNDNGLFTEYWYTDFNTYHSDIYHDSNFTVANYSIDAKYPGTYPRIFSYKNVVINDNALQLYVTVNDSVSCSSIGINREDILYGSFRAWMKTTAVSGTVGAFFMYENNSEIDMETLSAVSPPQTYFAIHPGLTDPQSGRASALTHTNFYLNYTPSQDYHEYRFDWTPGQAIFYIDGKEANRLYTNIPTTRGRIVLNHWTDGNANFSQGPPKSTAVMEVKNITMFFNSSTAADAQMECKTAQQACPIDKVAAEIQPSSSPEIQPSSSPSSSAASLISTVASHGILFQLTQPTTLTVGLLSVLLSLL